ncbi:NB-ARC [Dillenia turbinata]|uniref:NB-ARC n=1 Tax=Dillenia turbinata TaxID=194707 RepID=A0AAN8ZBL0_9MAGN
MENRSSSGGFNNFGMDGCRRKTGKLNLFDDVACAVETIPTKTLVGESTAKVSLEKIWEGLMDENVTRIGVWGMGGVGKTTLMVHIYNKILQSKNIPFKCVYWITVSQEFSIYELQGKIANAMDIDLSSLLDENIRAARLCLGLKGRKDFVLILDDVWKYIDFEKVGMQIGENGSKMVLTSRILNVCNGMGCQKVVKVEPLNAKESLMLFMENLTVHENLSAEVRRIAEDVARECAGLPLAIVTIAKSMAGVYDIREWRAALKKLEESRELDDEDRVFERMKFSYDRLPNEVLKNSLLYFALYPEDCEVKEEKLLGCLIDEGLIEEGYGLQESFDRASAIVSKLVNASLLHSLPSGETICIKMHDVIRDTALKIKRGRFLVKAGLQLRELPYGRCWGTDLEKVSLMNNNISKIPPNFIPRCHQLSTLLLCRNHSLTTIPDSFFWNLQKLHVLDLSYTNIKNLPDYISELTSLRTMLLRGCSKLERMPYLGKLTELEKLDLSFTSMGEVPNGTDMLVSLKSLNLCRTRLKVIPDQILCKLDRLECLLVGVLVGKVEVLMSLQKLEILGCGFENGEEYYRYTGWCRSQEKRVLTMPYDWKISWSDSISSNDCKHLGVSCSGEKVITRTEEVLSSPSAHSGGGRGRLGKSTLYIVAPFQRLDFLQLKDCNLPVPGNLQSLESLWLSLLDSLSELLPVTKTSVSPSAFSLLKIFRIGSCPKMKKLFPPGLLLPKLQHLHVSDCISMEEIFAAADAEEEEEDNNMFFTPILPNLKNLLLHNLPELKGICGEGSFFHCGYIQYIFICNCRKLKRLPLYVPMETTNGPSPPPFLQRISIDSKEWWEALEWEWDHPFPAPNRFSKSLVEPFLS